MMDVAAGSRSLLVVEVKKYQVEIEVEDQVRVVAKSKLQLWKDWAIKLWLQYIVETGGCQPFFLNQNPAGTSLR